MAETLILAASAACWGFPALVLVMWWMSPGRRIKRALRGSARQDHAAARGSKHGRLLARKLSQAKIRRKRLVRETMVAEGALIAATSARDGAIAQIAEERIVRARFQEVPGIGPKMAEKILRNVFHGRLDDLRHAHRVSGVGDARQLAIDRWIVDRRLEMQRAKPITEPERAAIEAEHGGRVREAERQASAARSRLAVLDDAISRGKDSLALLRVSPLRFELAMSNGSPTTTATGVPHQSFVGMNGDWEAPPAWLQTLSDAPAERS